LNLFAWFLLAKKTHGALFFVDSLGIWQAYIHVALFFIDSMSTCQALMS
jgi:hypothetical protein